MPSLDLERYQGRWLQIAALPVSFLEPCVRDVTAEYDLLDGGEVRVLNSCTRDRGRVQRLLGRGRVVGPSSAQLEVTFVRLLGEWRFRFAGDYWVIGLSPDYEWAVVGEPGRSVVFVLSRTPTLPADDLAAIEQVLVGNGYDPCAVQVFPVTGGPQEFADFCTAVR